MNIALIIAGGRGMRMGQEIPKQFLTVEDKPVIAYTMEAFEKHPDIDVIAVVCVEGWDSILAAYARQYGISKLRHIVPGGENGQASIRNGVFELERRYAEISPLRGPDDAWVMLSHVALAHKRCDFAGARAWLARIIELYPGAAGALIRQAELPDGEFARLRVVPYSEDELILAISEGIVLLQEGNDRSGRGVLGSWVAREVARLDPAAAREAAVEARPGEGQR